jgi:hypothetical protein
LLEVGTLGSAFICSQHVTPAAAASMKTSPAHWECVLAKLPMCLCAVHCLQDFVSDVADLNPEYCVGSILQDLLASDSPDAQLIALRTLHLVATSVPADSTAALDVRASMPRRSTALAGSSSSWLAGGRGVGGRRMVQVGQELTLGFRSQHSTDSTHIKLFTIGCIWFYVASLQLYAGGRRMVQVGQG